MICSDLVKLRFDKAHASYAQHAQLQARMCAHLYAAWQTLLNNQNNHDHEIKQVLELGMGTGNLTQYLSQLPNLHTLYANDLCASSAASLHAFTGRIPNPLFLGGDMETLAFPKALDAVVSASALQWVNDLPCLLHTLTSSLKPRGWLVFATFGPEHYQEIKRLTGVGLEYISLSDLQAMLQDAYDCLLLQQHHEPAWFDHPLAVLRHMQKTGVSGISKQAWNKRRLQQFVHDYQTLYANASGQVRLSQHPIYIIARKKA